MVKYPKKLIEVALPLDEINEAAAREKSIRHGHPFAVHLWWARRPISAVRPLLFAQLVNDPGGERGWGGRFKTKEDAEKERNRLFKIMIELSKWENINNGPLLKIAHEEILKSWGETQKNAYDAGFSLPQLHDPFSGGCAIPLEAQRLGLEAVASDINPLSVLICKAMLESAVRFSGRSPIGPLDKNQAPSSLEEKQWQGTSGVAEDIMRYGQWFINRIQKKLGRLYPGVEISSEIVQNRPDLKKYLGRKLTPIAWIYARTVNSPNPAYADVEIPLVNSFVLSCKKGKEYWVEPNYDHGSRKIIFTVKKGVFSYNYEKTVSRKGAVCIASKTNFTLKYIREEGKAGRMRKQLMAVVLEGDRERVYISPINNEYDVEVELYRPDLDIPHMPRDIKTQAYGMDKFWKLFTDRQLALLSEMSEQISSLHAKVLADAKNNSQDDDNVPFEDGGGKAKAYADLMCLFMSFLIDQLANQSSTLCGWNNINQQMIVTFSRQALQMTWNFAESNPFSTSTGSFFVLLDRQVKAVRDGLVQGVLVKSQAYQADAAACGVVERSIVTTDPPYFGNICYANLSDFFYVWARRSLREYFPKTLLTIATPKEDEIISNPYIHGSAENADMFFKQRIGTVFEKIYTSSTDYYPVVIYYAFKESDTSDDGTLSVGWATFLESLICSGFQITGTWPIKSESSNKLKRNLNALASSIVLVCRKRSADAQAASRKNFLRELKEELPSALEAMIGGKVGTSPIAPVDLAQAAIGPGMAIFSRHSSVIEADGSRMLVHDALIQINKVIDEYFNEAEGDMDSDTRFCIDWFMQYGFKEAEFGQADVLARAKGTTVEGLDQAGVIESGSGKVRLFKSEEYPADWDPEKDARIPIWEALHQLICALRSGGEVEAGLLLQKMADRTESIRQLAYRLYTLCERQGWSEEAREYNELIASWHGTIEAAEQAHSKSRHPKQLTLDM